MLKAMGIEEDAIEQIIEAHTETTDDLKAERDRYKPEAGKVGELADELEKTRKQLEKAESNDEYEELERKYAEEHEELRKLSEANQSLQSEFDTYKREVEAKENQRAKAEAYRGLLGKAGIAQKYVGAVMRVADLSDVELDEDGSIKDAEQLTEKVKGEFPEFVAKTHTEGANTETPPASNKTTDGAHERALQIAKERHERLYGKSEE